MLFSLIALLINHIGYTYSTLVNCNCIHMSVISVLFFKSFFFEYLVFVQWNSRNISKNRLNCKQQKNAKHFEA
uniref:Putative secreted protein n=1 Tax=Xenopsylla cheopis TaxID=163159 RepID=A0A6M2DX32_XENCH